MITGRSASRSSATARSSMRASGAGGGCGEPLGGLGLLGLHEHVVEREVEERRAGVRAQRLVPRLVDQPGDLGRRRGGRGELDERPHERHVVDLLQRALAPAHRGRAAAEHEHRRVVLLGGAERAHAVRHARAGGQRAHARLARHLRPALGGERRGRLVAHVDEVDPLRAAAVVDREQMAAREREQLGDAVRLEAAGDQAPPVQRRWSPAAPWSWRGNIPPRSGGAARYPLAGRARRGLGSCDGRHPASRGACTRRSRSSTSCSPRRSSDAPRPARRVGRRRARARDGRRVQRADPGRPRLALGGAAAAEGGSGDRAWRSGDPRAPLPVRTLQRAGARRTCANSFRRARRARRRAA